MGCCCGGDIESNEPRRSRKATRNAIELDNIDRFFNERSHGEVLAETGPGFYPGFERWPLNSKVFDFNGLQRLNLKALQKRLIDLSAEISKKKSVSAAELDEVCITLERYATAIRNIHFICGIHARKAPEQERLSDLQAMDRWMLKPHTGPTNNYTSLLPFLGHYRRIPRRGEKRSELKEGSGHKTEAIARFLMAAFGGAVLIGPMLIMSFHPSQVKSLVTSSLFVLFVAFILAAFSEASTQEILAATAAYTAVLVVFVGSAQPGKP